MISIDTETTGLHWQHDTIAFAIGIHDGDRPMTQSILVDPMTRQLTKPWPEETRDLIRAKMNDEDAVVFQNANFDIKALCKAGVFEWDEPSHPDFWNNILELGHLSHLHDSRDSGSDSSLKALAPKYLDVDYDSEKELDRIVHRCRTFCARRTSWKIASKETLPYCPENSRWIKTDMWLPRAVRRLYPDQAEAQKYFKEDYDLLDHVVTRYLKDDCVYTWDLASGFLTALSDRHDDVESLIYLNTQLFHVVWKMETLGVHLKQTELDNAIQVCEHWINTLHTECQRISGRHVDKFTPADLIAILFEEFGLQPISLTQKTKVPQVTAEALIGLKFQCMNDPSLSPANDFLTNLLACTKYEGKLRYLKSYREAAQVACKVPYQVDAPPTSLILFPSLKSTGTGTTRFSSSNPNSQNIGKATNPFEEHFEDISRLLDQSPHLRTVFGPPEGFWWLPIDYAQLQLRIFAFATKEPELIQSFRDGKDYHDYMGHVIFDLPPEVELSAAQRRIAKNVNFGFIFGASEKKIDKTAHRPGLYSYLMACFPNAHEFITETKEQIRSTGVVYTLGGYPLHIPMTERFGRMSYAAHMGVNYIVQGTEGEIVKRAMRLCDDYLTTNYPDMRLVMNVHDELVFQTPAKPPKKHIRALCTLMEHAGMVFGVETPVDAEVCISNLAEKIKVKL